LPGRDHPEAERPIEDAAEPERAHRRDRRQEQEVECRACRAAFDGTQRCAGARSGHQHIEQHHRPDRDPEAASRAAWHQEGNQARTREEAHVTQELQRENAREVGALGPRRKVSQVFDRCRRGSWSEQQRADDRTDQEEGADVAALLKGSEQEADQKDRECDPRTFTDGDAKEHAQQRWMMQPPRLTRSSTRQQRPEEETRQHPCGRPARRHRGVRHPRHGEHDTQRSGEREPSVHARPTAFCGHQVDRHLPDQPGAEAARESAQQRAAESEAAQRQHPKDAREAPAELSRPRTRLVGPE
jgi:hypothetical protein